MKLLAIDGNSVMNRAFYGIKALSNKKGVFTNAITGFMNIYLQVYADIKPDACAVAFDLRAPTFRHKANADYKANRKGMPSELAMQMPLIKELLTNMGIAVLECEGYEADDILGTLSTLDSDECYILTGDKDSLQLVTDKVTVLLHGNKGITKVTPEKFAEMYEGLEPIQLIDLKALMGDSSDNIKGIAGIGQKTALAIIKEHSSIEKLYDNVANGQASFSKSVGEKINAGKDDAYESKWLATIVKNAPISMDIDSYKYKDKNESEMATMLVELEMYKLAEKLKVDITSANVKQEANKVEQERIEYIIKDTLDDVATIDGDFSFILKLKDDEKKKASKKKDDEKEAKKEYTLYIAYNNALYKTSDSEKIVALLSSQYSKVTFDAKKTYHYALENGSTLEKVVADAYISGYLLDAGASDYTIESLSAEYGSIFYKELGEYTDIASLTGLAKILDEKVKELDMTKLLKEVELPLTKVLAYMEHEGVNVDIEGIKEFGKSLECDIEGLREQIYFLAGSEFNISSPKQLGKVLFEDLGLPVIKKTQSGYSTNADVLEELADKHPIIDLVQEYRKYTKLQSTYVEGLIKVVSSDGRIHSIFKQTETRTGRISSIEPNLQNIPIRTELGRTMRKFFIAKEGYTLIDADYSQIELRVLAHMSSDKNMCEAFSSNKDIHTSTASQVFGLPLEMVTDGMRRTAKAVNFGIVYGIGAFSLSKDINVTVKQADRYIKSYLENYSGVRDFMDNVVKSAEENGYALTLFNRRRYIPELKASNKNIQAFGKRVALNAPVQGTAADIIKIAMVKVFDRLKEEKLDAKLILQVHDELIIEAKESDAKIVA